MTSAPTILLAASPTMPSSGLLIGLMLLAAILGGYVAHLVRLPRVIGYMGAGIALKYGLTAYLRAAVENADPESLQETIHQGVASVTPINSLALGLILFMIGGVFDRQHMRSVGRCIWRLSMAETGLVVLLVTLGAWAAVLIEGMAPPAEAFGLAMLLGAAAAATAPAATLLVLQEYESKGPTTDATLILTGLNNIISIVLFHVFFLVLVGTQVVPLAVERTLWLDLVLITIGSAVIGCVLGVVLAVLYGRLSLAETLLVFFAILLVLGVGQEWIKEALYHAIGLRLTFNFLLVSLAFGAVFANIAVNPERLQAPLRMMAVPIFAAFFVLAGFNLHLNEIPKLKWLGGAYIIFRVLGKYFGGAWGRRWAHMREELPSGIGFALLCQAGVAIGLGTFLTDNWDHPLARRAFTVILAAVAVFELIGPLAIKWTVLRAGEVKAITLMRRAGGASVVPVGVIFSALARWVGLSRSSAAVKASKNPRDLHVRQLMRTNVKFIPPDASFEDVIHFMERSRFSSFPVVGDDGEFYGMVEFADIREMMYDPALHNLITAVDLARPDAPLVPMNMTLGDLFDHFHERNVEAFPVVTEKDSRKVIGVVEQRDLLRALHIDTSRNKSGGGH